MEDEKNLRRSKVYLNDLRNKKEVKTNFVIRKAWHRDEYLKCFKSPIYFASNWVQIKTKNGLDLFELYPYQKSALSYFMNNRFTAVLKSRQLGLSMVLCVYALWMAMFQSQKTILIISIKHTVARNMLRRIKRMYQYLPSFLQMEIINGKAGSMGTADEIVFANGSSITVSPASPDAARSETLDLLIMDETAFMPNAGEIWASAYPTLTTSGGGAILNSTPYGVGGLFYDVYTGGLHNTNAFKSLLIHWSLHPDKDINWFKEESRNLGRKRTAQELECEFLTSGYNVFDLRKIRQIEEELAMIEPIDIIGYNDIGEPTGYIYEEVDHSFTYTIGADVSSGKSRDFSTFSVMRSDGVEVACYKGKCSLSEFTDLLEQYGTYYNMATIAPEVNNMGNAIVELLIERNYPNMYIMKDISKVERGMSMGDEYQEHSVYGWLTTGKTRNKMLAALDDDLERDEIVIRNPFFCKEAYTFIYNENNKPIALGKDGHKGDNMVDYDNDTSYHDDMIIAVAITNMARKGKEGTYDKFINVSNYI